MDRVQIHPLSDVQSREIGEGILVWHYCVIFAEARIGKNCNICAQVLIEGDVVVGDNVTIKSGVHLWDGTNIEDDVFIDPNVTIVNSQFLGGQIKDGASIGVNTIILPGLAIGEGVMAGAGTKSAKFSAGGSPLSAIQRAL